MSFRKQANFQEWETLLFGKQLAIPPFEYDFDEERHLLEIIEHGDDLKTEGDCKCSRIRYLDH